MSLEAQEAPSLLLGDPLQIFDGEIHPPGPAIPNFTAPIAHGLAATDIAKVLVQPGNRGLDRVSLTIQ